MKTKELYNAPEMEQLELKLASNQMQVTSTTGEQFSDQTGNDNEDGWS